MRMATLTPIAYGAVTSGANSETANFVDQQIVQGRRQLQESRIFGLRGAGAFDELKRIYAECLKPDWDGYGAAPVSESTYRLAIEFLESLPLGTPIPLFGAEPDGHLTFEWYRSPKWVFTVSLSPEGVLYYAALFGTTDVRGSELFFGEVSEFVLSLIRRTSLA